MEIVQFVTEALGDASYLAVSGVDAAVVDPQRDVRPYVAAAEARGARITRVFETHVHNDYISGGPELAALGAEIVAPADAGLRFAHRPAADGDEIAIGAARVRAVAAPGHTHHHTAYLALDEDGAVAAAFTGGSIIIGGAGRTDLLGPEDTEALTRLQWESAQRIAHLLPEHAELLPTHGAGSFCSSQSSGGERRAALAVERPRNIVLSSPDFETFRVLHLTNPGPIPAYYPRMAPINREGPRLYGLEPPRPALLNPSDLMRALDAATPLVDVRDRHAFAAGHVPGSLSIEEGDATLAYVGWLLPFNAALVLITEDAVQADRMTVDLRRIGYEEVRGYLPFAGWRAAGHPVARLDVVDRATAARTLAAGDTPVYDVRFDSDARTLALPGAERRPIDRAREWLPTVADDELLVTCAGGSRAATVASMLEAAGRHPRVLIDGGAEDLVQAPRAPQGQAEGTTPPTVGAPVR